MQSFEKVKKKIRLGGALQQGGIKIGGSGGGSKSRSRCVFGCANGAGVGEIALVIFYYSIITGNVTQLQCDYSCVITV